MDEREFQLKLGALMKTALTGEELAHLLEIRVCGCDGSCNMSNHCPQPLLDGIGADWIADHFEQLAETLKRADRHARFVEKVRERIVTGLTVGLLIGLERDHFEVYKCGPSEPKERKPAEPVKE